MELTLYELYQKMLAHMGPTNWWPADSKEQIMIEAVLIQNTTEANATRASQLIRKATAYDFGKNCNIEYQHLGRIGAASRFYEKQE